MVWVFWLPARFKKFVAWVYVNAVHLVRMGWRDIPFICHCDGRFTAVARTSLLMRPNMLKDGNGIEQRFSDRPSLAFSKNIIHSYGRSLFLDFLYRIVGKLDHLLASRDWAKRRDWKMLLISQVSRPFLKDYRPISKDARAKKSG